MFRKKYFLWLIYKMRMFRKKQYRKPQRGKKASAKPSKSLTRAVKQVVKANIETKTLNVPQNPGGSSNTANQSYGALSGIQYLVQDLWRQNQGTADSTALSASNGNRIGDKIQGIGFLMDYYFTTRTTYAIGPANYYIPYVKLRVIVFRQAFGSPLLSTPLVLDTNFLSGSTSTLQPINWDEGYVKDVLYDKVFVIRNNLSAQTSNGLSAFQVLQTGQVMHFKKYIKFPHAVKYVDNNTTSPNSTDKPIYVAITAEVDDAQTGIVPSGTQLLSITGYTRGWFKDA